MRLRIDIIDDYAKCTIRTGQSFIVDKEDIGVLIKHRWRINDLGYVFYGRAGLLHRLLMNPPDNQVVDHINGNPSDCRRKNMRNITQKQNSYNSRISKSNKTGYKGVSYCKERRKYASCICVDGKTRHLGRYTNPKEAALEYNKAASFYFGEFAKLNVIGDGEK